MDTEHAIRVLSSCVDDLEKIEDIGPMPQMAIEHLKTLKAVIEGKQTIKDEKIVSVKIAVAVDPNGTWCAAGWNVNGINEEGAAMDAAIDAVEEGEGRFWITADLPIPGREVMPGKIEKEK